jgi:hypothetical protein
VRESLDSGISDTVKIWRLKVSWKSEREGGREREREMLFHTGGDI